MAEVPAAAAFKDHFSGHAALYRRYRPDWPPAVFAWLAELAPGRALAWDAGTGNGQAAVLVAEHFTRVVACDASAEQLAHAEPHPRVTYTVATAERSGLADASVDLALSTQALHWFDHERYYDEVRRVVRPGGVVAGLTYHHPTVVAAGDDHDLAGQAIDAIQWDYVAFVRNDWAPERRFVDASYANLPFPFPEIAVPAGLFLTETLDLDGYCGYLATWSASQRAWRRLGRDPREGFRERIAEAWGPREATRVVRWPLAGRVGRVLP